MEVKEAAAVAKACILELFEKEQIKDLGLEEAVFHDSTGSWRVVIGFTRPWHEQGSPPRRDYKCISIDDKSGKVTSVTRDSSRQD